MINGTYTVTVKAGEETASGDAEVTAQHVDAIKILNKTALTIAYKDIDDDHTDKEDATGILVYYDVVDQYGESMRNSTTIDWSSSCHVAHNDKTRGVLTLDRTDDKAFTYGESVYITGVHTKSGTTVSETLTVGEKQALHSVEVKGFVKKGTSKILDSLPAGFKSNAYYIIYSVFDKNGNEMVAGKYMGSEKDSEAEVTFVSENILVIKEIKKSEKISGVDTSCETILTLDGVEYCAAFVEPGIDVNKGGTVNITAIANKTGKKSPYTAIVGDNHILKSFTLGAPEGTVADGEGAVIPFVALDQNGEKITDFVTLASQSDFNRLQLNASYGDIVLSEDSDGNAVLKWNDGADGNWNSNSEDGIDRPISLTAVVVGGETSNEMIYVQDKAYPVAIKDVAMDAVYVQRSAQDLTLANFTFIDQYGREITSKADYGLGTKVKDNGFFGYVNKNGLSGTEFSGHKFGIKAEFKGNPENLESDTSYISSSYKTDAITDGAIKHISAYDKDHFVTGSAFQVTSKAAFSVCADQTIKFSIERYDSNDKDYDNVSPIKSKAFQGVNINRVKGFEIGDLNTFYVRTDLSDKANGELGGLTKGSIVSASSLGIKGIGDETNDKDGGADPSLTGKKYLQQVKVTGKYNNETVKIPKVYFTVGGNILGTSVTGSAGDYVVSTGATGYDVIDAVAVTDAALKAMDLYDANSAKYLRKDATDVLKVTVYEASGSGIVVDDTKIVNTATKKVTISDAAPYAAEIVADDTGAMTPDTTLISGTQTKWLGTYAPTTNSWKVKDQYGETFAAGELDYYAYKISKVEENAARYADNNFAVDKNDTADATIKGAELGDKFLLTITAKKGATVTKDIQITVGADKQANITNSTNNYMTTLVDMDGKNPSSKPGLETQRKAALGSN